LTEIQSPEKDPSVERTLSRVLSINRALKSSLRDREETGLSFEYLKFNREIVGII